jgi:hypothetical protein
MKIKLLKWLKMCLLLVITTGSLSAQVKDRSSKVDSLLYDLHLRSVLGTGSYAPFLTAANQYDRQAIQPSNLSIWSSVHHPVSHSARFDYGFGMELDAQLAKGLQQVFPGELYLEAKGGLVVHRGAKTAVYGNQDPQLSSGGLIWSRNSRPFQRISIETDGYVTVPFTRGLLEVQGGLTHGWFTDSTWTANTLLHYKYAGFRLGGRWPIRLNFMLHHAAQWAGSSPEYGTSPATWDNYKRVFLGKQGNSESPLTEQINTLGNHIISKNLA